MEENLLLEQYSWYKKRLSDSEEEVNNLVKQGFIRTSLGKRILRAETAAIYALSVLGYLLEK